MPKPSPSESHEITTINYTLKWPHLENPSNTTFAGAIQYDICNCGNRAHKNWTDLGHLYTRYTCSSPEVDFTPPDDDLWVLQAPLGHINLLRPAWPEEIARRRAIHDDAEPAAFAGKTFLLLTGPCPRGRYQAWATKKFLKSLPTQARNQVESLTLLIQPYEEDCADDQGGRAYLSLAEYILYCLPAFNTLYLNIWGEETRTGTREFGFLFDKPGIKIVISWDWWSDETEEYSNLDDFFKGLETGMVGRRPPWEEYKKEDANTDDEEGEDKQEENEQGAESDEQITQHLAATTLDSPSSSRETSIYLGHTPIEATWEEVPTHADDTADDSEDPSPVSAHLGSDEEWSDAILTPLSPNRGESAKDDPTWHAL